MQEKRIVAREIVFAGTVQGVGFRYTAYEIARSHPGVSGWVRNHWDGSVHMHIQGEEEALDTYLHEIIRESRLSRLIEHVSKKNGTVLRELAGFRIER